jgi:hypothetical protein
MSRSWANQIEQRIKIRTKAKGTKIKTRTR